MPDFNRRRHDVSIWRHELFPGFDVTNLPASARITTEQRQTHHIQTHLHFFVNIM